MFIVLTQTGEENIRVLGGLNGYETIEDAMAVIDRQDYDPAISYKILGLQKVAEWQPPVLVFADA